MARSVADITREIADMTPEERGHLIRRVRDFGWPDDKKARYVKFIMLLGNITRDRRRAN